jgi:hypothetical protein
MRLLLPCAGALLLLVACSTTDDGPLPSPTPVPTATARPPSRGSSSSSSTSGGFDDPGDEPSDGPGFGCPQHVPLTESDLDKEIGWKPAVPAQGSCTADDITQLEANFKSTGIQTYFDLAKGVSDACNACVTSKDTDAKWGPIVGTAENNGETGFVNFGACFGAIEGDACGKAIQYENFCENIACNECATTSKERADCVALTTSAGGMCESFATKKTTACPSWSLNVKSCGDILTAIKTLCGAPS